MIRKKIFTGFFLITGVLVLSFSGCKNNSGGDGDDDAVETITPVTLTRITKGPVSDSLSLNAVSGFLKKSIIRASVTGMIKTITINPGDLVKKGQLLFTLQTKEAAAYAMSDTPDSVLAFKGIIPVFSSEPGSVVSILHQRGDYVQEGDELAQLSDPHSLIFTLNVPYELRNFIFPLEKCRIILTDGRAFDGVIGRSLPLIDMQSQTENFVVRPVTRDIMPGNLIANVKIRKHSVQNAVLLPKAAVLSNESLTEFWIMKLINDSVAVKVPIKKGLETDREIQIISPILSKSDRIILTGNYGLSDTAKISITGANQDKP